MLCPFLHMDFWKQIKLDKLFFNFTRFTQDEEKCNEGKKEDIQKNKNNVHTKVSHRKVPQHQKNLEKLPCATEVQKITESIKSEQSSDIFTVNFKRRNTIPLSKASYVRSVISHMCVYLNNS